ncbi:MAG: TetR/AcrR family transcriptional regulator [Firmicutes bacterium]|nr:TetR/AcrR family transcriptional regulator [Bacillota bacterium]
MRDKSKKRQLIMEAALQVFVEHGYEKTKIIDVARTAGIGKGTVYEYFESKEALFCCILEEYCEYYKEGVRKILVDLNDAGCQEKLLSVIRMEEDLKDQVRLKSLNPLQLMTEFSNFPGLKQAIQTMLKFKFETVCGILKEGVKTGEFRPVNIPLATAALMGASSAVDLISDEIQDYTDENLLDLLIRGMKA